MLVIFVFRNHVIEPEGPRFSPIVSKELSRYDLSLPLDIKGLKYLEILLSLNPLTM